MEVLEHFCDDVISFPTTKFLQIGSNKGKKVLILGEAPAPNGWRKSGRAFYTVEDRLLPTGKNLNNLLAKYGLSVEICSFTELIKCFVGSDRKLLKVCGKKCWPIFLRQLKYLAPKVIIVLGVKTLEIFNRQLDINLKISGITKIKITNDAYDVLPIYHPSPINPLNKLKNFEIFRRLDSKLKALLI